MAAGLATLGELSRESFRVLGERCGRLFEGLLALAKEAGLVQDTLANGILCYQVQVDQADLQLVSPSAPAPAPAPAPADRISIQLV